MALSKDEKREIEQELRGATPFTIHRFYEEVLAAHTQAAKTTPPTGAGFETTTSVYADALTTLRDLQEVAGRVYYGEER